MKLFHTSLLSLLVSSPIFAGELALTEAKKKAAAAKKQQLWDADQKERTAWIVQAFLTNDASETDAVAIKIKIEKELPKDLIKHVEEFCLGNPKKTLFISAHTQELRPAEFSWGKSGQMPLCDTLFQCIAKEIPPNEQEIIKFCQEHSPNPNALRQANLTDLSTNQLKYAVCLWQTRTRYIKENAGLMTRKKSTQEIVQVIFDAAKITLTPAQSALHNSIKENSPNAHKNLEDNYALTLKQ